MLFAWLLGDGGARKIKTDLFSRRAQHVMEQPECGAEGTTVIEAVAMGVVLAWELGLARVPNLECPKANQY